MRTGNLSDKRGESQRDKNKTPGADVDFIVNIINKLPKYSSHYRREQTETLYLEPGMTDTCNKCDAYATAIQGYGSKEEKELKLQEHNAHLEKAELLRSKMKDDFERAKVNNNIECLSFDLEQTLPLPWIPTNIIFYKRQLWVYNCGIHAASNEKGYCYVWAEGEAGRGAQEVRSCLLNYIDDKLPKNVDHLILWSDSCGGQNRNIKLTLMLKAALQSHQTLKTISMRFLEPGHTFLPNDTDFGKYESCLKGHQRLYSVDDYINVMKVYISVHAAPTNHATETATPTTSTTAEADRETTTHPHHIRPGPGGGQSKNSHVRDDKDTRHNTPLNQDWAGSDARYSGRPDIRGDVLNLRIIYWNPGGIIGKTRELRDLAQLEDAHIILLGETKLRPEQELKIPNFFAYRRD
ncbi:hypothetical protein EVAR_74687_1 [Eumeta japonica]|uniref:Uncharacterized protein n=1 Tax=Eumeta variegata TaxID=151549 RepID=A0A4C1YPC4_EUMVA|nr:hypothetical protein EVAR_74687_1 [Eumeta japonica]